MTNENNKRAQVLRAVGRYILTQHEEKGLAMLGVNGSLYSVETILDELDAMVHEAEDIPRKVRCEDCLYYREEDGQRLCLHSAWEEHGGWPHTIKSKPGTIRCDLYERKENEE